MLVRQLFDGVIEIRYSYSHQDDGTVVYKVSFTYDGQKYSYRIDAMTGKVLDKSTETAAETPSREIMGNGRSTKQANTTSATV